MEDFIKEGKDWVVWVFFTSSYCHSQSSKKKQHFFPPNTENRPNALILTSHFGAQFLYSACKPSSAHYTFNCLQKDKN